MAFHKCTNSQSCTQDDLCLMVGHPSIPISARFCDCRPALVWARAMAQAPRFASPSEKSLSKYTFGGLREILGCMWGVRQFRWTQRDTPLKSVSRRIHTPSPLWTDLLNSGSLVVRSASTDKIMAIFNEVSFGLALSWSVPAGLLMNKTTEQRTSS
jgi:hypothetical protein